MAYLSEKHLADLHSSGLDDEIIEEMGFYTCDDKEANEILDRKDIKCECLVIPYPNVEGFFRIKPDGIVLGRDGKPAKYLQRGGEEPHLYTHPVIFKELGDSSLPILIVEGEKKALKAAQEFYFNEPLFLPICFGGVWNWRTTRTIHNKKGDPEQRKDVIKDLANLPIDNRIIYICFDSDITTNPQVEHAESELGNYLLGRGAVRTYSIRIPSDNGKKLGIDDFLVLRGNDEFKKLIDDANTSNLVKANIKLIRKLPNTTYNEKLDLISNAIIKDLNINGKFIHDESGAYFFSSKTKRALNVEEEKFQMQVAYEYGEYRNTPEFKSVVSKIQEIAVYNGEQIAIKNVAYFDKNTYTTFVYDNNGGSYKIPKEDGPNQERKNIIHTTNGSKSIYFRHRDFDTIKYYPNKSGYFQRFILDVCNFHQNENTLLTHDQQILLFTVWFYSLFYPNLLPTKPILVMTGDYESGKSTIQRLVGKLLFGNSFNVSTLQSEKDFLTSVINKYYLVYDNVDIINNQWLRNSIASLSTGFKVEVRKLYSNMEMFKADPIAYLAMNSMSQAVYQRPDIASRLLIFRTKALGDNKKPEAYIHDGVERNRDNILSEVFDTIAVINRYIHQNEGTNYRGNFRMADFANLGFKIAMAFGQELEFENILLILKNEQSALPLEDNPMIDLIDRWLATRVNPTFISTGELYAELAKIASDTKLPFPWKSVNTFGTALNSSADNLRILYRVVNRRGHSNKMMWDIGFKG